VLLRHCEDENRDPSTILRTVMSPVFLVPDQGSAAAALERLAPERRATVKVATPAQAADYLQMYMEAGFSGFIFRNMELTPDAIPLAGELIKLMS
jgi:alkanesulfonate monooxygenase SsuD/methylene tetrahydromethanopterin reductase-like flavin-dependent oxidoreductase (luciferase family)